MPKKHCKFIYGLVLTGVPRVNTSVEFLVKKISSLTSIFLSRDTCSSLTSIFLSRDTCFYKCINNFAKSQACELFAIYSKDKAADTSGVARKTKGTN